jgi:hypothetical protein
MNTEGKENRGKEKEKRRKAREKKQGMGGKVG